MLLWNYRLIKGEVMEKFFEVLGYIFLGLASPFILFTIVAMGLILLYIAWPAIIIGLLTYFFHWPEYWYYISGFLTFMYWIFMANSS